MPVVNGLAMSSNNRIPKLQHIKYKLMHTYAHPMFIRCIAPPMMERDEYIFCQFVLYREFNPTEATLWLCDAGTRSRNSNENDFVN